MATNQEMMVNPLLEKKNTLGPKLEIDERSLRKSYLDWTTMNYWKWYLIMDDSNNYLKREQ